MPPDPTPSQPWSAWSDGPELSQSWPSSRPEVDVDRTQLKKVGLTMQTDLGEKESDVIQGTDQVSGLPPRFDDLQLNRFLPLFDDGQGFGALGGKWLTLEDWGSIQVLGETLDKIDSVVKSAYYGLAHGYENLA